MNDVNSWSDINWYALGNLLTQIAFLVAMIWFARNFLRIVRGFQEQMGALLKVSIAGGSSERQAAGESPRRSIAEASPYWLAPAEAQTSRTISGPLEKGPGRFVMAWRGTVRWLQEPMHTPEASAWRRMMHWLQAPAGS